MVGVNTYHRNLSDSEIAAGVHREFVGGLWEQIGRIQFEFMLARGLQPAHTLVDIGCGALRGGVHLIRYLEPGHYCGLDINSSLVRAGQKEVEDAGLAGKSPTLLVDGQFELSRFGRSFDYGISVSLFTHLYLNHIGRCFAEMRKVMAPASRFFCTFFEAPAAVHLSSILHVPGGVTTHYDSDPFHYAFEEISVLASRCGLAATLIGEWNHPRDQRMFCVRLVS
jgi:SAM-dependent methyltransferase